MDLKIRRQLKSFFVSDDEIDERPQDRNGRNIVYLIAVKSAGDGDPHRDRGGPLLDITHGYGINPVTGITEGYIDTDD